MVLCASLYTVQSTLETVQGMCMGEYAAATEGRSDCAGGATTATAPAPAGVTNNKTAKTTTTTDAATAATSNSSSSHSPVTPAIMLKNLHGSKTNESSRWSIGTQPTARTFPSDRFMEYLPDNPFFGNNSLYDEEDNDNGDDYVDEEKEHNLFKEETAAFFRACYAGSDCMAEDAEAEAEAAAAAAVAAEHRNLRSAANMLFSVDTDDGSSLRTPWTRQQLQHQATGPGAGATAAATGAGAAATLSARQEPLYLQKPLAAARHDDDDGVGVIPNRHSSSPNKDRAADLDHDQQQHASSHHSTSSTARSKRKKRPTYIVLYRPRTPWPLERLDVVWSYQRILDESSSSLTSPTSLQSPRRGGGGGSGRLTPEPCTTGRSSSNMDLWTGLLQDEEGVEIGRITGYSIHSSRLLDQVVNNSSSSSRSSSTGSRHRHHTSEYAAVTDPTVMHFAKTILNTTGAASAAAATPTESTTSSPDGGERTSSPSRHRRRPDMGPIFLITNIYICPEYRGTGLGLFLVDVACRRVADPLALVVLSCGNNTTTTCSSRDVYHDTTRQEPANEASSNNSRQREVVQLYFGLLGFAPISEQFLARRNGRHCPRVEEVCPHMIRNAVADSTTAMATEVVASTTSTIETLAQQTPTPRRQLPLSLAPPS